MLSVVYSRPTGWAELGSESLDLHHCPLGGTDPRRNSGKPAGDGIGVVALPEWVDRLEETLRRVKPALFVRDVVNRFDADMMLRCRAASPDTVWCLVEGNQPWGVSKFVARMGEFVDAVLINNCHGTTIQAYLEAGKTVVPCFWDGHHPEDHERHPRSWATRDCFFGGSNRQAGGEWEFPDGELRYKFIERMWSRFDLELRGSEKEWGSYALPVLSHAPYLQAMQRARVVLGHNTVKLRRYYTRRTIHSIASGRPYVVRRIPGMEVDFGPADGVFWFDDVDQAESVVRWLLDDVQAHQQASDAIRKLAEKHTWEARLRKLEMIAPALAECRRRAPTCVY